MMEESTSLSQGCFTYKPKKIFDPFQEFNNLKWNHSFQSVWSETESKLRALNDKISSKVLSDVLVYIKSAESGIISTLPTAVLLTGVNLPDHSSMFANFVKELKEEVSPYVAFLNPSMCGSVKHIIEQTTGQLMNSLATQDSYSDSASSSEEEEGNDDGKDTLEKRCNFNMPYLLNWYANRSHSPSFGAKKMKFDRPKLIIVLPDFESFSVKVLHDYIIILSGYATRLPIVLVMGVATTFTAFSDSLDHSVLTKMSIEVFQSERSIYYLNHVLDEIFFTDCPFQLGPSIFKFLKNVFLLYDFSVSKFTKGVKYCLLNHYFKQPLKVLCCGRGNVKAVVKHLSKSELQSIYEIKSFKTYYESLNNQEKESLKVDSKLKDTIIDLLIKCYDKIAEFYACLRLLLVLVSTLPGVPLGKQMHELYAAAVSGEITKSSAYKECSKLVSFHSKKDLTDKISLMISIINNNICDSDFIQSVKTRLEELKKEMEHYSGSVKNQKANGSPQKSPRKIELTSKSRSEFMKTLKNYGLSKSSSPFESTREKCVNYLFEEVFPTLLEPVTKLPLHEIIVCEGSVALKRHIVGCPRADIHLALVDPCHYLQCECCHVEDSNQILESMPDICVLYKLYLESSSLINLYDWIQSFAAVVNPDGNSGDDDMKIDSELQARFTKVVSELEFLGYIKSSKIKKDHVSKLTWGTTH